MTTLTRIRTKVRRLTGSPSPNQLTDAQIDEYVNDFYQLDFPEHLRLKELNETFVTMLQPGRGTFVLPRNIQINYESPMYVAGQPILFSQDPAEFYNWFPQINQTETVGTTDGSPTYDFTLNNTPVLRGSFTVSAVRSTTDVMFTLMDNTVYPWNGQLRTRYTNDPGGTIDYDTGAVSATFPVAMGSGNPIYANYQTYTAGRPTAALYFNQSKGPTPDSNYNQAIRNQMVVRPVPDKIYQMQMQVWKRPEILDADDDEPILQEWWQLLAVGAAKKVFEDRLDQDGVAKVMPLYQEQMSICVNRTAVQYAQSRTATIYSQMMNNAGAFGWNNGL